ncbi:MAG TPA: hypothetical protein VF868_03860 [Bacteroidia bacterium]
MSIYTLNILSDFVKLIKPITESDTHIAYTFICEIFSTLVGIVAGFKALMRFMDPKSGKEVRHNARDIFFVLTYIIISFICPIVIMVQFWSYPHSVWWYLLQGFSVCLISGFIGFVFIIRKINKMLHEEGLDDDLL